MTQSSQESKIIKIGSKIEVANHLPFVLFSGVNVLESRDLAMRVAEEHVKVTEALGIPYVFKGSLIRRTVRLSILFVAQAWKKV